MLLTEEQNFAVSVVLVLRQLDLRLSLELEKARWLPPYKKAMVIVENGSNCCVGLLQEWHQPISMDRQSTVCFQSQHTTKKPVKVRIQTLLIKVPGLIKQQRHSWHTCPHSLLMRVAKLVASHLQQFQWKPPVQKHPKIWVCHLGGWMSFELETITRLDLSWTTVSTWQTKLYPIWVIQWTKFVSTVYQHHSIDKAKALYICWPQASWWLAG